MNDNDRMVLENQLRIKDWVIRQHKFYMAELIAAVKSKNQDRIALALRQAETFAKNRSA